MTLLILLCDNFQANRISFNQGFCPFDYLSLIYLPDFTKSIIVSSNLIKVNPAKIIFVSFNFFECAILLKNVFLLHYFLPSLIEWEKLFTYWFMWFVSKAHKFDLASLIRKAADCAFGFVQNDLSFKFEVLFFKCFRYDLLVMIIQLA